MRIVLVIPSLRSGGAERVLSTMANYWVDHGNDITLITVDSQNNDFYALDPRIKRIGLGLTYDSNSFLSAIINNLIRIIKLRSEIKKPKPVVVISFIDHMNVMTLLAAWGLNLKVVISERIDPREHYIGRIKSLLRRYIYPKTNAIVMQTDELKDWAKDIVSDERVYIIPNPLPPISGALTNDRSINIRTPFIMGMGRLVPQKGFDILLRAFSQCYQHNNNWSLILLGEGPDRKYLEALSRELGIESSVLIPGRIQNPNIMLNEASIFVLSSRYEGFPNALLEAMRSGLPVISFDCPTGPSNIVTNGKNGILVPNGDISAWYLK